MSRPRGCNCASCAVCTCPGPARHCDREAEARRQQQPRGGRPQSHYAPEDLTSVSAASYRPPSAAELAAGRARAPKPEWSANTVAPSGREARFDAQTTAQSTYRGAQNPRPASSSGGRPFFDRDSSAQQQRPSLPFEATSGYHDEFRAHDLRAAAAQRTVPPDRHLQQQVSVLPRGARFDGSTTNRTQFQPYELEAAPAAPAPQRAPPPSLKFEGQSQTHADYGRKQRDPSQPLGHRHPESAAWVHPQTRFEAHTVNQDTYRGVQPSPQRAAPAGPPPARPSLPFTGESQSRSDYRAHPDARPSSRVRGDVFASHFQTPTALYSDDPRPRGSYVTETSGQYTPKQPKPCPAAAWSTPEGSRTPMSY